MKNFGPVLVALCLLMPASGEGAKPGDYLTFRAGKTSNYGFYDFTDDTFPSRGFVEIGAYRNLGLFSLGAQMGYSRFSRVVPSDIEGPDTELAVTIAEVGLDIRIGSPTRKGPRPCLGVAPMLNLSFWTSHRPRDGLTAPFSESISKVFLSMDLYGETPLGLGKRFDLGLGAGFRVSTPLRFKDQPGAGGYPEKVNGFRQLFVSASLLWSTTSR